jgi:hypothetical protein
MVKLENSTIDWGYVYFLKGYHQKGKIHGKTIYYVGCTGRPLNKRMDEHFYGKSKYTSRLTRISLEYYFMVPIANMYSVERYFKDQRLTVYSFVEKECLNKKPHNFKKPRLEKRFFQWCDTHNIKVIDSGKIKVQIQKVKDYAKNK